MDFEIKKRWIAELELTGKYTKGLNYLKQSQDDTLRHCCLGVLCELYAEDHPAAEWYPLAGTRIVTYEFKVNLSTTLKDTSIGVLPIAVCEWSGVMTPRGEYFVSMHQDTALSKLNDDTPTFEAVIEIIKEKF